MGGGDPLESGGGLEWIGRYGGRAIGRFGGGVAKGGVRLAKPPGQEMDKGLALS